MKTNQIIVPLGEIIAAGGTGRAAVDVALRPHVGVPAFMLQFRQIPLLDAAESAPFRMDGRGH